VTGAKPALAQTGRVVFVLLLYTSWVLVMG